MQKRYLINPDGTIPWNAPVAALSAAGVIFVVPTPLPALADGEALVEGDAEQDAQGVWRQVWQIVPANPVPAPMPDLSRGQWVFLQFLPQIAPLFEAVEATLKVAAPMEYAALMAYKASDGARWDKTFELIASFTPFLPEGVVLSEEFLRPLWLQAASF